MSRDLSNAEVSWYDSSLTNVPYTEILWQRKSSDIGNIQTQLYDLIQT